MDTYQIRTQSRSQYVEITDQVRQAVAAAAIAEGICVVSSPHTTAGISIQENADPDVVHDLLLWFDRLIPKVQPGFQHGEGNSDSHIKTTLVGTSVTIPIHQGQLVFGTWQGVYFCEFDGPRTRTVHVQVIGK